MRSFVLITLSLVSAEGLAGAQAPIPIVTYDVEQTPRSGWGCWTHEYSGVIVNTGRTVSGSVTCTPDGNSIANYFGGSGTLNDLLVPNSVIGAHLFTTRAADDGQPIRPVITLHLGGLFLVNTIVVRGGNNSGNAIPGALTGVTVDIGGNSAALSTTPSGVPNALGTPVDDVLDLTQTALSGVATDSIVLRDFNGEFFGLPFDQFSIGEIEVLGSPAALTVGIDVKPDDPRNRIRSRSGERISVAILSTAGFDAASAVDRSSVTFGKTGDEHSLDFCVDQPRDINGDRRTDLVCFFDARLSGFSTGDLSATLKGRTTSGLPLIGRDDVCVDICR